MPGTTADLYLTVPLKKHTPVELTIDGADTQDSNLTTETAYSATLEVTDPELILDFTQAAVREELDEFLEFIPEQITDKYDINTYDTNIVYVPPVDALIAAAAIHTEKDLGFKDIYSILGVWGSKDTYISDTVHNSACKAYHNYCIEGDTISPCDRETALDWLETQLKEK